MKSPFTAVGRNLEGADMRGNIKHLLLDRVGGVVLRHPRDVKQAVRVWHDGHVQVGRSWRVSIGFICAKIVFQAMGLRGSPREGESVREIERKIERKQWQSETEPKGI